MKDVASATNTELLACIETAPEQQRKDAWNELMRRDKKSSFIICACAMLRRAPNRRIGIWRGNFFWSVALRLSISAILSSRRRIRTIRTSKEHGRWFLRRLMRTGIVFIIFSNMLPSPTEGMHGKNIANVGIRSMNWKALFTTRTKRRFGRKG